MSSHFLIIDGHSLAYRAFYALPSSLTLNGTPVNAVFGFATLLFRGLELFNPSYLCVCFDRKEPTYRHQLFPEYKAQRQPTPEAFKPQVPLLKSFLEEINIPILEMPGYEADDLLGTLAKLAEGKAISTLLMTGDTDAYQLVSPLTTVVMNKKGVSELDIITPKELESRLSLLPYQMSDFKALKGDASDNIPGVTGVGEKTAISLLQKYHSLEAIYDHINDLNESLKSKLEKDRENAFLSKKLAQIQCEAPLSVSVTDLTFSPDWTRILPVLKKYEFSSLYRKYQEKIGVPSELATLSTEPPPSLGEYRAVQTLDALREILPSLKHGFSIDLETTSLQSVEAQIVGIALSVKENEAYYLPMNSYLNKSILELPTPLFETPADSTRKPYSLNPYLKLLKPILENPSIPKYTHHGKYEYVVLQNYGVTLRGIQFDTLLAPYLLYSNERLNLKDLTFKHFHVVMKTYEDVAGKGKHQLRFDQVPVEDAVRYAGADADFTLRLKSLFSPLIEEKQLHALYYDIEHPLQIVLAKMEQEGVCLDLPYLYALSQEFTKKLSIIQSRVFELAGCEFNINSTKQLGAVLFEKLKLPIQKKTKTGLSTDASVLEFLQSEYEIARVLIEYRTLEKLLNTYVNTLPKLIVRRTGRIHTSFNQTIAQTGRLSSSNPNLQNIPIRTEEGMKIRRAFIPSSPDNQIVSADYSQIELRLMAHLARDENMINAFRHHADIHQSTASIIYNVPLEAVTTSQRREAKAVNFGILYGMGAFGLSQNLHISRQEARDIIDHYFKTFPKVRLFIQETIEQTQKQGFVRTEFGRIRFIPDIQHAIVSKRRFAERMAVNTRVQGTAADIMKLAMIHVQNGIEKKGFQSKMIIQVHDELVFDSPYQEYSELTELIKTEMEGVVNYTVPLTVNISAGQNWMDA